MSRHDSGKSSAKSTRSPDPKAKKRELIRRSFKALVWRIKSRPRGCILTSSGFELTSSGCVLTSSGFELTQSRYVLTNSGHKLTRSRFILTNSGRELTDSGDVLTSRGREL